MVPMIVLATNITVVVTKHILINSMLLIIWSVNNHQIVTGIIVVNIVKHNINKYINVNADNFIFVL